MARRILLSLATLAVIAGCGGNPLLEDEEPETPVTPTNPVEPLPGTGNPTADASIRRYEERDETNGNGYAEAITYDAGSDTFSVDNLGFDGANAYSRGTAVASLGPYRVYEAAPIVTDPQSGLPIQQFDHRLLAGVSDSGRTSFAIVRTGAYVGYGFGGFLMTRDGGVDMPTTGQATYSGAYAGVRDFNGAAGMELTDGQMTVDIDFEDFNAGDAVKGVVYNRHIYDLDGNDITGAVLTQMNAKYDPDDDVADMTALPTITFNVGPGVIDTNGEIRGALGNHIVDYRGGVPGTVIPFETGNYYAIVSGPDAVGQEVVGIIVVTSEDPAFASGVTARETGGFILYR